MLLSGLLFGLPWFVAVRLVLPDVPTLQLALGTVVAAVFFGVVFGGWAAGQRRAAGPAAGDRSLRRALRTGVLPPDVDVVAWRRAVEHRRTVTLRQRWSAPLSFGAATVLYVVLAVTSHPLWWLAAVAFCGLLVAVLVLTPRTLRTTSTLLDELDRRQSVTA